MQAKIGTAATDLLISQSAEILREATSEDMLPARLSDHVMALRIWFNERSEAESLARKLVGNYSGRILEIRDKSPTVTASVGLAIGSGQMFSVDELLSQAGSALQDVERAGGNGYARYQPPAASSDSDDIKQWTEKLRHALNNNEFRLVRLPITSMEDDNLLIYEIETRLRSDGNDEIILPSMFRPAAIQSGLAVDVDRDQIRHVLRWQESNPSERDPFIITISAQSLTDDSFIEWLQSLVDAQTLDARRLILGLREPEIRESLRETQRLISRFAARGVRFALLDVDPDCKIDLLIKNININFIKLSSELSAVLRRDEHKRASLRKMTDEATANDIQVISPQVENTSDLAALWQFGITLVQDDFVREDQA
ncbi:MAG: EAL domain-containing protein [Xanthomonadaceae bacterium]|nr:EAL domain-containing protein [Xanthomonadaceae bacterium]